MDEFKNELKLVIEKLAEHDTRIISMEITIHGINGKGGIYEKIDNIESTAKEQKEATKTIEKVMYKGFGFIAAICFIVPIILKFISI